MSLLPRWEAMTDGAKTVTKWVCFSAVVIFLCLWVIRTFIPWVIIALVGYWTYRRLLKAN